MTVIKRNGEKVKFDRSKIMNAIAKASFQLGITDINDFIEKVTESTEKEISKSEVVTVEEIQDIVVKKLMGSKYKEIAIAYQSHRAIRTKERADLAGLMDSFERIIEMGSDENANKDASLPNVERDLLAGELMRYIAEKKMPISLLMSHRTKVLHYHDTDFSGRAQTNCSIINLEDMLENGTRIVNADVEAPNSIDVAATQASQIVANVAHQQYGGISIADFNYTMAKYAEKTFRKHLANACDLLEVEIPEVTAVGAMKIVLAEMCSKTMFKILNKAINMTKKSIYDAMQTYEYQTNSISSASQTPFSTITFNVPRDWVEAEIISAYLKVRMNGLGAKKKLAIFPKISYVVKKGLNLHEGDEFFWLTKEVAECISKCYYPDILHEIDYARMGCRSRVNTDYRENGEPVKYGRFNFGVHTMSLAQAALRAIKKGKKSIEGFMEELKESSKVMEEAILHRFNFVKEMKPSMAPILFMHGAIARMGANDDMEPLLRSGRASISYGYMGLDDAVRLILDKTIKDEEGSKFAEEIMQFIYSDAERIKKEHDLPVSVYGTPAESLIWNAFKKDLENYSKYMPEWLINRGYYTNSYHFSSELDIDAFEKLEIESKFVKYSNGGNINYSELGLTKNNPDAIIELIQYGNEIGIEYQAFNIRNDKCYACGFEGEIKYDESVSQYRCPQCGNHDGTQLSVIKRLCGYLSDLNERKAVKGRIEEIEKRKIHLS